MPINLRIRFFGNNTGIPSSPSSNHDIPSSDLRALDHFHHRTSKVLGGWLLAPFWSYHLPQLAHSQPSTRHAIIAISTIHENIEWFRGELSSDKLGRQPTVSISSKDFAERHYQAAVSALASSLAAGTANEEVALTSCAMFVVFNFMSGGNFARAVWHLQYGLEIFSRWKKTKTVAEGSLEGNIVELMKRISLDGQAMEETVPIEEQDDVDLAKLENLEEAGRAIEALAKEGLRLIRMDVVLSKETYDTAGRQSLEAEVTFHISNLAVWQSSLEAIIAEPQFLVTAEHKDHINQLRIMHLSARIWMYAGFPAMLGSQPMKTFEIFISLVNEQYDNWQGKGLEQFGRTFLFNKGLLPTITYIITSSSDESLKARALALWTKSAPEVTLDDPRAVIVEPRRATVVARNAVMADDLDPQLNQVGMKLTPSHSANGSRYMTKELPV